jgi:hypothetical protein
MASSRKSRKPRKLRRGESPTVNADWVLTQLAGMRFPKQGEAFDFMKRAMMDSSVDGTWWLR